MVSTIDFSEIVVLLYSFYEGGDIDLCLTVGLKPRIGKRIMGSTWIWMKLRFEDSDHSILLHECAQTINSYGILIWSNL